MIVFGSLMGAMFIGQQFLQNVLGYSTVDAGLAILPAAFCMVLVAPRSAKLVEAKRRPLHAAARLRLRAARLPHDAAALEGGHPLLEGRRSATRSSASASGLAGTPASHSLTGSVPVTRVGMASGTADLQRDLGGAIMQSIFGALLTAGYAAAAGALIVVLRQGRHRAASQAELTKSFSSAADTASRYPSSIQDQIIAGAKTAFLQGDQWAYTAGIVAVLLGAVLVYFKFPRLADENRLLAEYHAQDTTDQTPSSATMRPAAAASSSAR